MEVLCIYGALEKLWCATAVKNINKTIKANSECSSHSAHSCDLKPQYSRPFSFSTCTSKCAFSYMLQWQSDPGLYFWPN